MKKIIPLFVLLLMTSCAQEENKTIKLPDKEIPESAKMSDSPLSATNIDQYLFIDGVMYVDTRDSKQFNENGHIAGFINIPFYETIACFEAKENILFRTSKVRDESGKITANIGDVGSYTANYIESEKYLNELFPKDRQIVFIATAGVESAYLINLLIQYDYNPALLYNAGAVENSLAPNIAYFDIDNAHYLIEGIDTYTQTTTYVWPQLTPVTK